MTSKPTSPFERYLGTSYTPSDEDVVQIQDFLKNLSPELSKIDLEIETTSQALAKLKANREAYVSFLAQHRALIPPIRRLSFEIMYKIFQLCLPTDHNAVMAPDQAPLLLTQVCHHWRDMAFDMPLLWSSIHIPIPPYPTVVDIIPGYIQRANQPTELSLTEDQKELFDSEVGAWHTRIEERTRATRSWLSRAKGSNLSISLYQRSDGMNPEPLAPLVDMILGYAPQWERLKIAASDSMIKVLLSLPEEEVPQLRHLDARFIYYSKHIFLPGSVVSSPLKTLSLKMIDGNILDIPVQWENLTELSFARQRGMRFGSKEALDLLGRCPNLTRCLLVLCSPDFDTHLQGGQNLYTESPPRCVTLARLTRLTLHDTSPGPKIPFVRALQLPSLSSLSITTLLEAIENNPSPLLEFMRNWGHNIKKLAFDYDSLTSSQLCECLELAKNVKSLCLTSKTCARMRGGVYTEDGPRPAAFSNKLLSKMVPQLGNTESVLCPLLSSFSIDLRSIEFGEETLLRFIRARRHSKIIDNGVAKIKKVNVKFNCAGPKHQSRLIPGEMPEADRWPLFAAEKEKNEPDVDLEGLKLRVRWRQTEGPPPTSRSSTGCVWSPTYGLFHNDMGTLFSEHLSDCFDN